MTSDGSAFLDAHQIQTSAAHVGLPEPALHALQELASRVRADASLRELVSAAHHAVYATADDFAGATARADAALGPEADLLHGLLVLDSVRLVLERQGRRGVSPEISRAVNDRHGAAWLRRAVAAGGQPRIADWQPRWLRLVASGELYRLGRLEFVLERWQYPFRVYAHCATSETIVLSAPGASFGADGYVAQPGSFTSTWIESAEAVVGTPISPRGFALASPVRLSLAEWKLELDKDDWVLDLHVPGEGELSVEALRGALSDAEKFFDRYYPKTPFKAYVCDSWLFNTQLEAMLGSHSNILRWQREGYLLPTPGGHEGFLSFTFGSTTVDPRTAPRDTQLRRAVLDHLERGGRLRAGAHLLLRRDIGRFGAMPYRAVSDAAIRRLIAESAP
jgi:hypothetical protein